MQWETYTFYQLLKAAPFSPETMYRILFRGAGMFMQKLKNSAHFAVRLHGLVLVVVDSLCILHLKQSHKSTTQLFAILLF